MFVTEQRGFQISIHKYTYNKKVKIGILCFYYITLVTCGPGSVVGIATGYGLEGPGIESRWGEIFRSCPDWP